MKFKYFLIFMFLILGQISSFGQELIVNSFTESTNDLAARQSPRYDLNNDPCALVKVNFVSEGAHFEPNVIGDVEYKVNEYWVYLPKGSKHVKLRHPNFLTLDVKFSDYGIRELKANTSYYLTISTPQAESSIRPNVLLRVEKDANIHIDGKLIGHGKWNGTLKAGQYVVTCTLKDYKNSTQIITIENGNNYVIDLPTPTPHTGILKIRTTPIGANIVLDGKSAGNSPLAFSNLTVGNHTVQLSLPGYNTIETIVEIKKDQETQLDKKLQIKHSSYSNTSYSSKQTNHAKYSSSKSINTNWLKQHSLIGFNMDIGSECKKNKIFAAGGGFLYKIGTIKDVFNVITGITYKCYITNDDYSGSDSPLRKYPDVDIHTLAIPITFRFNVFEIEEKYELFIECAYDYTFKVYDSNKIYKNNSSLSPAVGLSGKKWDVGLYYRGRISSEYSFQKVKTGYLGAYATLYF